MQISWKRWLFLAHRWLGIAMCLLFTLWFFSGMVMMYVGYPKLTEAERLLHLPELQASPELLSPQQALSKAGISTAVSDLRLSMASAGRASYWVIAAGKPGKDHHPSTATVIDAYTGSVLPPAGQAQAMAAAAAFAPGIAASYQGQVQQDAFTHSRGLDAHRPLHVVALDDAAQTRLYISSQTGEVLRDATATERGWNYVGAWLHWLYLLRGNWFDGIWADVVNTLSIAGIALAISGTVVGVMRWRFARPYRSGQRTPYPSRLMRWHHIVGLLFAAVTLTWIFSGLMSMNPWHIFDSKQRTVNMGKWPMGAMNLPADAAGPAQLLSAAGPGVRELRWSRVLGQTQVTAVNALGHKQVLNADTAQALQHDKAALLAGAAQLSDAAVLSSQWLSDYDLYYYARADHTMMGGASKPLPVLRVIYGDAGQTWLHIDATTGQLLGQLNQRQRLKRWLFAMLHSWDWLPLLQRRPLWDGLLIALSLGGLLLSGTGVVIGLRRLRPRRARH
ncbi:MAG: PepSY domain-containing protein [Comamonas sp.]